MTLIIGSEGSMGTRYKAILKHLGENFQCTDVMHSEEHVLEKAEKADQIIVCTPTPSHAVILRNVIPTGKKILCEKPISKSLNELDEIFNLCHKHNSNFNMTFQYQELVKNRPYSKHLTHYNYFRTGKDGPIWDCLQIIALANGEVEIKNNSPIWTCAINGYALTIADMDGAYVSFIQKWLKNEINQDHNQLFKIHEKVEKFNG